MAIAAKARAHRRSPGEGLGRTNRRRREGGTLVRLLPSLKAHVGVMHAVFPGRRGMIPAVRALLDLLSETVRLLPS